MRISLNVAVSRWRAPDFGVELEGGRHDLPNDDVALSSALVRTIGAAAGAGVIEILDADAKAAKILDGAVESDQDSLKVYEEAVASGVWLDGHLQDVMAQREQRGRELRDQLTDNSLGEEQAEELLERAEFNERLLEEASARLAAHRGEAV